MRASTLSAVALATVVNLGSATGALAQEYCVVCAQPDATYRCVIGDARLAGGQPLQAFCMSSLAKEGGHQGCRIKPGTVFDCDGPIKRLATAQPAQKPAAMEKPTPPTVSGLAREAVRSSGEQAEKTGEAIGSGAKNAWGCVLSLFTSC